MVNVKYKCNLNVHKGEPKLNKGLPKKSEKKKKSGV